jgi:hypothetical protein
MDYLNFLAHTYLVIMKEFICVVGDSVLLPLISDTKMMVSRGNLQLTTDLNTQMGVKP